MSELLKINVNEHTEKKNGLTYLSWAWAWAEVLKLDPQATWKLSGDHYPCHFFQDGTAMVTVEVTIKGHAKHAVLPVMDHRNKAIKNPDAFAINTAIQRCLAKAIAMHGLGLYIYAGEDLPEGDGSDEQEPAADSRDPLASFKPPQQKLIRAAVEAALQAFAEGKEYGAYEEVTTCLDKVSQGDLDTENRARMAIWSILNPHPALRSAIKRLDAGARSKQKEAA
jgi:hypothetical protein